MMKTKAKSILLALLALFLALALCFGMVPVFAEVPADTNDYVLLKDDQPGEGALPAGTNTAVMTKTATGISVTGKQTNSRTVAVFDRGIPLGSKIKFDFKVDYDATEISGDSLKQLYNFGLIFGQTTKIETGHVAGDFTTSRRTGNGFGLQMFTDKDMKDQKRSTAALTPFNGVDIMNVDTTYGGSGFPEETNRNGVTDLGWAFSTNNVVSIEMGPEIVGGENYYYLQITVDRSAERGELSVSKLSFPLTAFVSDDTNKGNYYVGFEFANKTGTERNVAFSVDNFGIVEPGLSVTPATSFLKPNGTVTLITADAVTGEPVEGTLASENTAVATVAGNIVTAVAAGSTKITVTSDDGKTGEAYVTVADSVTVEPQKELPVGGSAILTATTNPAGMTVLWSSSDAETVSVDNGLIVAKKTGTATISATIKNFEAGDLLIKAECVVTVVVNDKLPADQHGENYNFLFDGNTVANGTPSVSESDGDYQISGSFQNGGMYLNFNKALDFEKGFSFDFIFTPDVSGTTFANQFGRYFGIYLGQGNFAEMTAENFAMNEDQKNGVQIHLTTNAEWWAWGGKFMLPYQLGYGGSVQSGAQTAEHQSGMTYPEGEEYKKFANAFARAFCDGTRIQAKFEKIDDKLVVSFTPVFIEGDVPDGSDDSLTYPGGSPQDVIGPYKMIFNWSDICPNDNGGDWYLAIGAGNSIPGYAANFTVGVENLNFGELNSVSLNRTDYQMPKDATYQLKATLNPNSYVPEVVSWVSSDPTVASVSDTGLVTALKGGKTMITYTADGKSATCEIHVLAGLTISDSSKTLTVGESFKLTATPDPADAIVTFVSGDPRIATVDAQGNVIAVAEGEVTIYVRLGDNFSKECKVTVKTAGSGDNTDDEKSGCGCGTVSVGNNMMMFGGGMLILSAVGAIVFAIKRRPAK